MVHKAWSSIEDVSYCFPRSSVKCQGHMGQKIADFDPNRAFRIVTPVWIHRWLWNDAQGLTLYRRGALLFFKVICQISRSHGKKITDFDLNWAFSDCNSGFNSPMDLKWWTKLDVVLKRCPIVFRGHPSSFKVTQADKLTIWIQFELDY